MTATAALMTRTRINTPKPSQEPLITSRTTLTLYRIATQTVMMMKKTPLTHLLHHHRQKEKASVRKSSLVYTILPLARLILKTEEWSTKATGATGTSSRKE